MEDGFWFNGGKREMIEKVCFLSCAWLPADCSDSVQLKLAAVSFPSSAVSRLQMNHMLFIDRKAMANYSEDWLQIFHITNQMSMNPSRLMQRFSAMQCSVQCKIFSVHSE